MRDRRRCCPRSAYRPPCRRLASGLRVAAAVAPIGAVIGEWVGSSAGLGYLMLQANARMQTRPDVRGPLGARAMASALCFAIDRGGALAGALAAGTLAQIPRRA